MIQAMHDASATLLQADRDPIKIRKGTEDGNETLHERIISANNITDLAALTVDLWDDQELRKFDASRITVIPNKFDLDTSVDGGTKLVNITIDSTNVHPGVYIGKLYILNPTTQFTIPITITIHAPEWKGVGLILGGVIFSFFLKVLISYVTQNAKISQHVAKMINSGATKNNAILTARAKIPHGWSFAVAETVGGIRITRNTVGTYLAAAALITVSIVTAWQGYYPNLTAFGRSDLDYIAAFLYGFAGNAALNQAIDLIKKK